MLNEMEKDALTEIFNIFVGRAAGTLSEMTNHKIELFVPSIDLLSVNELNISYLTSCLGNNYGHIMSSSLQFGQEYNGKAFLLFPASQAKLLVSLCLNDTEETNNDVLDERKLLDTDFDVMKEIGNIILNSVVGGLGNLLSTKFIYSLPEVEMVFVSSEQQIVFLKNNVYVLVLKTAFLISDTKFCGAILIVFSMDSLTQLISEIDNILEANNAFTF